MDVQGRNALITGGAHRVGRAIALALAGAGANVGITFKSSAKAAAGTVEELTAVGVQATAVSCDVSDEQQVVAAVEVVEARLGPVDILVNSASEFTTDRFPTSSHDTWHRTFDVVLHGAYYCAGAVAPGMLERERGLIVNIVDLSAWQPWPARGAHSVAKAASLALMRQLAVELAPNVRANAVALGPTIAPERFDEAQVELLRNRTLLGRWAGGEEAGRAVRYLVEAAAVTGECLTVDGGEQYGHVRHRFSSS
jgi:3-oxoacyl-[acyl-carrier protein] reductase/pteridine reductase